MDKSTPLDRYSVASSLPSIMGDGEEGGGEDPWNQNVIGAYVKEEQINYKERYEELEMTLDKFRLQAAKVRDILKEKLAELEEKVWVAERKAEEAEMKVQVMERKFLEIKKEGSLSVHPCCSNSFTLHHSQECLHKECVIASLQQQVEEQKRLRICDAKQVEDKAAKIKEWVTNKLKELEEQNHHLREQNQKSNVQLELLKSRLNQQFQLSSKSYQKQIRNRGSTEDSSRGSFEDHGESDESLPPPEVLEYPSPPIAMRRVCREHSLSGTEDICYDCAPSLPQESDHNTSPPNSLYASVDYSSKKRPPFTCQARTVPPRVKLERKKYTPDGCLTPSTISTTSEVDCSSWNRSSRVDSGSADVDDTLLGILSPAYPVPLHQNDGQAFDILSQRQSLPPTDVQASACEIAFTMSISNEAASALQNESRCIENSTAYFHGSRPLTAPNGIISNVEDTQHFNGDKYMPDKSMLTLDDLARSLNDYKEHSCNEDEIHDYAEIYTPNKECSEIHNDLDESEVLTDEVVNCGKPPTPPLHRFPSWESRIYEVALNGINVSSPEDVQGPIMDSSNNNQSKTSSCEAHCSNAAFTELNIPVYATVKGRASQIRSVPFTGDSSDSSDNEDIRVTMTTTSSQTTSGDTGSSASVSAVIADTSPVEKRTSLNHRVTSVPPPPPHTTSSAVMSKCHGTAASPLKLAHREMSSESVLSDDYAVPPDAVSVDVSINSTDNQSVKSTPIFYRRGLNSDDLQKKEPMEKSGYLTKLGGKFKTWRRRWFVLRNGILSYYKSQADISRKPQGQIVLDHVCRISRAEGAATFEISTGKRTYYLTADSINMMEEWIKVLQNVLRQNATRLLLTKEGNKPTAEGWLTKVKHGHSRRCWCVLIGRMFLYFKTPNDSSPLGQINMRDARVEEVVHVSDSDDEDHDHNKCTKSEHTVGIFPNHQGPTYLLMDNKQELDAWVYHLTVVSSGDNLIGTQYEQLIAKLMEVDGEENCVIWKHPLLLYSKDSISQPLTTLPSEQLQQEAIKLFKSLQLFISVPLDTSGIEYHVALAQNALLQCLIYPELQNELFCQLIKQTSRHCYQRIGVQQLLICATQSLFLCDTSSSEKTSPVSAGNLDKPLLNDSKLNPAPFVFVQAWQLLALAVPLFVPKNRTLWYLRSHLQRNANSKLEAGKYAIFCQRALERALTNGPRECKPSRMEALSILLKNPYHHSLPHSIPVHFVNGTYQVFGFDGSTTVHEFTETVNREMGIRDSEYSGFALFSDDPIEKDLEHCLLKEAKLCDVISQWEQALRVRHLGKFENTKVLKLTYKNRLLLRQNMKAETDKERLLLVYQINEEIMEGRFPLTKELAFELAALLAQIEFGDYCYENNLGSDIAAKPKLQMVQILDQFLPKKFRDANNDKIIQEIVKEKWMSLKGRSNLDCVRIYLNCARKWSFSGGKLFLAKFKSGDQQNVWLAVAENCIAVLDATSMQCLVRYSYSSVMTFGGCRDDFMLVVNLDSSLEKEKSSTERLLFAMAKPKILEITLLVADYMNAIAQNEMSVNKGTKNTVPVSPRGSISTTHTEKVRSKIRANNAVSQSSNTTMGSIDSSSSPDPMKMNLS